VIVFDFDGVIADSDTLHWEAYRRALARHGIAFSLEDYVREAKGRGRSEVIERFAGDLQTEAKSDVARVKSEEAQKLVQEGELTPLPGCIAFLESAAARGLTLAVASTSVITPTAIERMGLGRYFEAICAKRADERAKPHPDVFRRAFREIGVAPECGLVVEDTPTGAEAGLSLGAAVVGLGELGGWDEAHLRDRLTAIVPDFATLHAALDWGPLTGANP